MAYPAYKQHVDSKCEVLDDLEIDRASNGAPRGRANYTAPKLRFAVKHQGLSIAEWTALYDYYVANRKLTFDFTWAKTGLTYTCLFAKGGAPKQSGRGGVWVNADTVLETT